MAKLPPQIDANTDDPDALVIHLPRDQHKNQGFLIGGGLALLGLFALELSLFLPTLYAFPWLTLLLTLSQLGLFYGLQRRFTRRTSVWAYTITLNRSGLTIDDDLYPQHELASVYWDCEPPTTDLVLVLRSGRQKTYPCNRRNIGDKIGVTRRQRGWLEHQAGVYIEKAGSREGVPEALSGLKNSPKKRQEGSF